MEFFIGIMIGIVIGFAVGYRCGKKKAIKHMSSVTAFVASDTVKKAFYQ